jgi:hypothetical protein
VVLGRLREELSCRIGAQECLHELFGLIRATRLLQRAHQRELRRLQLRVESRARGAVDRWLRPCGELQQAATKLLVTLGVPGSSSSARRSSGSASRPRPWAFSAAPSSDSRFGSPGMLTSCVAA